MVASVNNSYVSNIKDGHYLSIPFILDVQALGTCSKNGLFASLWYISERYLLGNTYLLHCTNHLTLPQLHGLNLGRASTARDNMTPHSQSTALYEYYGLLLAEALCSPQSTLNANKSTPSGDSFFVQLAPVHHI